MNFVFRGLLLGIVLFRPASAQDDTANAPWKAGRLYANVGRALERNWPDRKAKEDVIPDLLARYEPDARAAHDLAEEASIVSAMLAELHASHLALYSRFTYDTLLAAVFGHKTWSFGLEIGPRGGEYIVLAVHDDGPAARAGLLAGDVVLAIDGVAPARSPRLDLSSDDAALDDPPRHLLIASEGAHTSLRVVHGTQPPHDVDLGAERISLVDATRASAKVLEVGAQHVGYLHFWAIHEGGCASTLKRLLHGSFASVDAIVLDLRGRGGSAAEVARIVTAVREQIDDKGTRFVALIDEEARSAKELLAARLKSGHLATLVGRKTAGAVLPANFVYVDAGHVLMLPGATEFALGVGLEGVGVEPDVLVPDGPGDPILARGLEVATHHD